VVEAYVLLEVNVVKGVHNEVLGKVCDQKYEGPQVEVLVVY